MTGDQNVAAERKRWFQHFPEGSIEFTVVTRVLALLLLASLVILPATQRPVALAALAGMVWLDYVLVIWWAVQMACDLDDVFAPVPGGAAAARRRRMLAGVKIMLPSLPLLALIAPWPAVVIARSAVRATTMQVLIPVALVLFCILAVGAVRNIRRLGLADGLVSVLLLIPVVHWLALHRVLHDLADRLSEAAARRQMTIAPPRTAGPDILLVIAAACWVAWGLLTWTGGGGTGLRAVELLSVLFGALFAVTDVATMEGLQRQFVAVLRKI